MPRGRRSKGKGCEKSSQLPTIPAELATDAFGTYKEYTFCRTVGVTRDSPHHIRRLTPGERELLEYHTTNRHASAPLCGKLPAMQVNDMIIGVNLDFNHVCEDCAWIYLDELLRRQLNG